MSSPPRLSTLASKAQPRVLDLSFRPAVSRFISLATTATDKSETMAVGTRGDGKTWGAFGAMIVHAQRHHEQGYPLPTLWSGVTDTHQAHRLKTVRSLQDPAWGGLWRFRDDYHVAECVLNGTVLVHLDLFGIEDQGAMDRLRMEMHGLWFEEPAPASVMVQSSGVNEGAWLMGITSCRKASYHNPKIMTLNYPDEEHWTWRRFVTEPVATTQYVRIPPGERASAEQRAEWMQALASRPDMLRRLLEGQPGTLMLGKQVAIGFTQDVHVRPAPPVRDLPVWIGQDGGESHTWVSVLGQRVGPHVRIIGALLSEPSGARQHFEHTLRPWLAERTPWALQSRELLRVIYDQACDTEDPGDHESNPLRAMRALFPGHYAPGPVDWLGRLNPLYSVLNAMVGGVPVLQVDPGCRGLIRALDGGWYLATGVDGKVIRDTPKKPNHPHEDFGDALCYLLSGMAPLAPPRDPKERAKPARAAFDPFHVAAGRR